MCEGYAWESGSIGGTGKNYDSWKICFYVCSLDDSLMLPSVITGDNQA